MEATKTVRAAKADEARALQKRTDAYNEFDGTAERLSLAKAGLIDARPPRVRLLTEEVIIARDAFVVADEAWRTSVRVLEAALDAETDEQREARLEQEADDAMERSVAEHEMSIHRQGDARWA